MIETEQELLSALTMRSLPHRWVAREPNTNRFYVTGKPFPTVAPDVVLTATKRGVLIEHVPGLWSRPQDAPPPPTQRPPPKPSVILQNLEICDILTAARASGKPIDMSHTTDPTITINATEKAIMLGADDKPMTLDFWHVGSEIVMRVMTSDAGMIDIALPTAAAGKLRDWLKGLSL